MTHNLEDIAVALNGKKSGTGYQCQCPAHDDEKASLSLSNGDKGIVFRCHAGCAQADVLDALKVRGLWNGVKKTERKITATYDYTDASGKLVLQVVRYEPKDFRQRRPDGTGGWIWNLKGITRVPYRLPEVQKAIAAGETICVVEGEKDADTLRKIGLVGTCNSGGAGKWGAEHSLWLKGANIIVVPDNDDPGREHAQQVAASLDGIAATIKIVALPGLPPKADLSDWISAGGSRQNLEKLAGAEKAATESVAPGILGALQREMRAKEETLRTKFSKPDAVEVVQHLAALSKIEYDQEREAAAKLLSCRVTTLDDEVQRLRDESVVEKPEFVKDVDPWSEAVNGAELLDIIREMAQRFLILPRGAENALALWIVFSHAIDEVQVAPILAIVSPEKRCGKTTVLDFLSRLARRALASSNITQAALFRSVEKWKPALLIDEADTFLSKNDEMRGMINSGHTPQTAFVIRTVGEDHEPKAFSTWCAKAIALIGKLPDTLQDRSIVFEMRRKLPGERIERLRHADPGQFETVSRKCARWVRDNAFKLKAARPEIPERLNDRAADNWEPLLGIADCAGGRWPELARETAIALSGGISETDSTRVELLKDMRTVFHELGKDRLSSESLIKHLVAIPESRWSDYYKGKEITQRQVARLLAQFKIKPGLLRIPDEPQARGYDLVTLRDTFSRYLPPFQVSQRPNAEYSKGYSGFASVPPSGMGHIENDDNSLKTNEWDTGTDKKGGSGEEGVSGADATDEGEAF